MNDPHWHSVTIDGAGYIRKHDPAWGAGGYGWTATPLDKRPTHARQLRSTVVVATSGTVYVTSEVLGYLLGATSHLAGRHLKVGRRKLWAWEDDIREWGLERNGYPPRNEREDECKARNRQIIRWLDKLAGHEEAT